MKHLFYTASALLVSLALQAQPKEWEDQRVNQINREPIHAHFVPYSSEPGNFIMLKIRPAVRLLSMKKVTM